MRKARIITGMLLLFFIGIQMLPVEMGPSENTDTISGPPEVVAILKRACFDCHSNKTRLAWFDRIAPLSWVVAADVREGRKRYNFSNWDKQSASDQRARLWEIYNMAASRCMPLRSYLIVHPEARVEQDDLRILQNYLNTMAVSSVGDPAKAEAAALQYKCWREWRLSMDDITPSLNGISWIPEYTSWQVLSTTARSDNGTMRVVYANDIAIQAVRHHHLNPWPNGAILIKVVWDKLEDSAGIVRPGRFLNAQYMIRDEGKYRETEGWGFARFDAAVAGTSLVTYGTETSFDRQCINCHKMVSKNGFVFDLPADTAAFGFDDNGLRVITTYVDTKKAAMSTLYGNEAALHHALEGKGGHMPGEDFFWVTRKMVVNGSWYGSMIDGAVVRVEKVSSVMGTVNSVTGPRDSVILQYRLVRGERGVIDEPAAVRERIDLILGQRPSVFP